MKNSKLVQIVTFLSKKEIKELKSYLSVPLLSNRVLVSQCFDYIMKVRKQTKEWPSKATIFEELFPKETYKDEKVRLVMSQLVKVIEDYWIYAAQQTNQVQRGLTLAKVYREKKFDKAFQQTIKTNLQQLEARQDRSARFYFEQYKIKLEEYNYTRATRREGEQDLQLISDTLDTAFIIEKLEQACRMLSQQAISEQQYNFGLLDAILKYIEKTDRLKTPAIRVYYHGYYALQLKDAVSHFQQFKQCLLEFEERFLPDELHGLYLLGINCCIKIINTGQPDFLHEILSLYKRGIKNEALLENGILSRFTCQNIVTAGLRTGEYEWTRWFLETYQEKLEHEYRQSAYRFNLGRLAYSQQKYEKALVLLRNTDHKDLLVNLFSKTLLLKIYYELEETQLLDSFLDAFAIYLRRKKVIGYHRTNYKNIIAYTKKLMTVNPYDEVEKNRLHQQLTEEEILSERMWLLQQLELL